MMRLLVAGGGHDGAADAPGQAPEGGDELSHDVPAQHAEELALQSAPMKTFNDGTPRIYTSAPEAKFFSDAAKFDL